VSWDTRQCKVLIEYPEHVNHCSAVATVGVDKNSHFLYAGLFMLICLLQYNIFPDHFLPYCFWLPFLYTVYSSGLAVLHLGHVM